MKKPQYRVTNWTREEDEWLKNNYSNKTIEECADYLDRTKNSVCCRASQTLKLKKTVWSREEENYLILNYNIKSLEEICFKLSKKTKAQILNKAHRLKLKLSETNRSLTAFRKDYFNQDYFENIDTFEKAYWLGFIWSDGYVPGNGVIKIMLQARDIAILKRFKQVIKSNSKIRHSSNRGFKYVSFLVHSKKMTGDLKKYNLDFNKTYSQVIPNLPEAFLDGFFLGLMDGDGCVYNNKKYTSMFWSGTSATVTFIRNHIKKILNKEILPKVNYTNDSILFAKFTLASQKDIFAMYKFLYKRATFFLKRKEKKIRKIFQYFRNLKPKLSKFIGVTICNNRYMSRITINKEKIFLGYFDTEVDAANVYDRTIIKYGVKNKQLNFPHKNYDA